ncbi:hypothetical protein FT663_03394 [Candidozyma haemuli var. vulneris]|nr:hypothetical protein FT662_05328 [[Candida] haemuloni var. vulneris]KAF3989917.1 hypothetical protein FT663_03394 [[Candida] haemuloni var. vulneris]
MPPIPADHDTVEIEIFLFQKQAPDVFKVPRCTVLNIRTKSTMVQFVRSLYSLSGSKHDFPVQSFSRRSKKKKGIVSLETLQDFREMRQSLKVKSHLLLYVKLREKASVDELNSMIEDVRITERNSYQSDVPYQIEPMATGRRIVPNMRTSKTLSQSHEPMRQRVSACDGCNQAGQFQEIQGRGYKCTVCNDYDLCTSCFEEKCETGDHQKYHLMDVFHQDYQQVSIGDKRGLQVDCIGEQHIEVWDGFLGLKEDEDSPRLLMTNLGCRMTQLTKTGLILELANCAVAPLSFTMLSMSLMDPNGTVMETTLTHTPFYLLPSKSAAFRLELSSLNPPETFYIRLAASSFHGKSGPYKLSQRWSPVGSGIEPDEANLVLSDEDLSNESSSSYDIISLSEVSD